MSGSKRWSESDRTGGPLDDIFCQLRGRRPDLLVERIVCPHPADDDNLYWIHSNGAEVQVETREQGQAPFAISGAESDSLFETADPAEATRQIELLLNTQDPSDLLISEVMLDWLVELSAGSPTPWRAMVEGATNHSGDDFIQIGPDSQRREDLYIERANGPAPQSDLLLIAAARTYLPILIQQIRWERQHRIPPSHE